MPVHHRSPVLLRLLRLYLLNCLSTHLINYLKTMPALFDFGFVKCRQQDKACLMLVMVCKVIDSKGVVKVYFQKWLKPSYLFKVNQPLTRLQSK